MKIVNGESASKKDSLQNAGSFSNLMKKYGVSVIKKLNVYQKQCATVRYYIENIFISI